MLRLVRPDVRLRDAWSRAHAEWGPGLHEDGFGIRSTDDVGTPEGFAAWVDRLLRTEDDPPEGHRGLLRWVVEEDEVLGGIALRTGPDELVERNGHVGYGVRPSARGRGVATWALARMLAEARLLGLSAVLAVCDQRNTASAHTIERAGGALEEVRPTEHGAVLRFRVPT
jgi:predicted acetyltransferase